MAARRALVLSVLRIVVAGVALVLAPAPGVAVLASAWIFFACFALAHDLVHGALGLSRSAGRLALSLASFGMLLGGEAVRRMHLRHHARPLADDDLEGEGARVSFLRALLVGPRNAVALRVEAFRSGDAESRRRQAVEHAVTVLLVAGALASGASWARVHVAVAVVLQLTMALWASHVPHRAPAWLASACARLAFLRSPVLLSLAFHETHHRRPRIPCAELGAA